MKKEIEEFKEAVKFKHDLAMELEKTRHQNKINEILSEKEAKTELSLMKHENEKSLWRLKRADRKRETSEKESFRY